MLFVLSKIKKTKQWNDETEATYRACAHNTLVALPGWEELVISERLPWLINTSIILAGFHRSPQSCRDPGLIWRHITQDSKLWTHNKNWLSLNPTCDKALEKVYLCILDNTAEAQTLGSHMPEGDTWLCYISHGLSVGEIKEEFTDVLPLNPPQCQQLKTSNSFGAVEEIGCNIPLYVRRQELKLPLCRRSACRTWTRKAPGRDASCLLGWTSCLWKYIRARSLGAREGRMTNAYGADNPNGTN